MMCLTEHLAVFFRDRTALTPRRSVIGFHLAELISFCLSYLVFHRTIVPRFPQAVVTLRHRGLFSFALTLSKQTAPLFHFAVHSQ